MVRCAEEVGFYERRELTSTMTESVIGYGVLGVMVLKTSYEIIKFYVKFPHRVIYKPYDEQLSNLILNGIVIPVTKGFVAGIFSPVYVPYIGYKVIVDHFFTERNHFFTERNHY